MCLWVEVTENYKREDSPGKKARLSTGAIKILINFPNPKYCALAALVLNH